MARDAFPDLTGIVDDVVAQRDRVAGRVIWHGTHRGLFVGVPATGRRVAFPGFHSVRLVDGRVAEWWGTADLLGALTQVGAEIRGPGG
jgi:predicted ester cyclase